MKPIKRLSVLAVAVGCLTVAAGAFATTSTVNPAVPAQNAPLSSAALRNGISQPAYNDITNLYGLIGSSAGISALTGDVTASGTGSVASALANTATARNDIGLGASSTPTHAGLTLTKNVTSLPLPQTGTVLQLGNTDGTAGRVEMDAFGAAGHYTVVDFGGTAASPTALAASTTLPVGSFNIWGYNGTSVVGPQAAVRAYATQAWSVGSNGTQLDFAVTPNGSSTLTQAFVINQDGGLTSPGVTGGDKGVNTINVGGVYINGIAALTTGGSGGSSAISSLMGATTTNSIDNAVNTQTWTWNSANTQDGLDLSSSSITTGALAKHLVTNAASTGYAGYFSNSGTGAAYGVYSVENGTNDTGYAGYFANNATTTGNYGLYASTSSTTGYSGFFAGPVVIKGAATGTYLGSSLTLISATSFGTSFIIDSTLNSGGDSWGFTAGTTSGSCSHCFEVADETSGGEMAFALTATATSNVFNIQSQGVYGWGTNGAFNSIIADAGISRASAATIDIGNGTQGNTSGTVQASKYNIGTVAFIMSTAPTISSGFGTSPTVPNSNGPGSFTVNVGTGGSATSGVVGLPTAAHGWNCHAVDNTNVATIETECVTTSTTTATCTSYSRTTGSPTAWSASDILGLSCFPY